MGARFKNLILPLVIAVSAVTTISFAQTAIPGAKHPVAQLVEWELLANAEMNRESLQRMADVILDRVAIGDFPPEVRDGVDIQAYKAAPLERRKKMLDAMELDHLKKIVVMPAPLDYFEISLKDLSNNAQLSEHELSLKGLERARQLTHFTKNGEPYIRWFIHPLADADEVQIAKGLEALGIPKLQPHRADIMFHFTSSRSIIVFQGSYDHAMSLKLSLPAGVGPFKNKAIHIKEYSAWARHNAYVMDLLPSGEAGSMKLQPEPYGYGVALGDEFEDAFLFRNITEVSNGETYLLPAFAALHDVIGTEIARLNGSSDPMAFWGRHLIERLADGTPDLRAMIGAEHTSLHTQNLLIELDRSMRPTGRIVLRDFDFYIDQRVFMTMNRVVKDHVGIVRPGYQVHGFVLRNGLHTLPRWLTDSDYNSWIEKYFKRFKDRFAALIGQPVDSVFEGGIYKYQSPAFTRVEASNYITGGFDNFHVIKFKNNSGFQFHHARWLEKRKISLPPVGSRVSPGPLPELNIRASPAPQKLAPAPTPKLPFNVHERGHMDVAAFGTELRSARSIDDLVGRVERLRHDLEGSDLTQKKEVVFILEATNLRRLILASNSPSALLELARLINTAEPLQVLTFSSELNYKIDRLNDSRHQWAKLSAIIDRAREVKDAIFFIRYGETPKAMAALKRLQALNPGLTLGVADAFIDRIKSTDDNPLRNALALTLASIGKGDATTAAFFKKHLQLLEPRTADRVVKIMMKTRKNIRCESVFIP